MRQQLQPWHSNELAAARRAACRVGPPGSCFVSDDIIIKSIFLDECDRKGLNGMLSPAAAASARVLTTRVCVLICQIFVSECRSRRSAEKVPKSGVAVRRVFRIAVGVNF